MIFSSGNIMHKFCVIILKPIYFYVCIPRIIACFCSSLLLVFDYIVILLSLSYDSGFVNLLLVISKSEINFLSSSLKSKIDNQSPAPIVCLNTLSDEDIGYMFACTRVWIYFHDELPAIKCSVVL